MHHEINAFIFSSVILCASLLHATVIVESNYVCDIGLDDRTVSRCPNKQLQINVRNKGTSVRSFSTSVRRGHLPRWSTKKKTVKNEITILNRQKKKRRPHNWDSSGLVHMSIRDRTLIAGWPVIASCRGRTHHNTSEHFLCRESATTKWTLKQLHGRLLARSKRGRTAFFELFYFPPVRLVIAVNDKSHVGQLCTADIDTSTSGSRSPDYASHQLATWLLLEARRPVDDCEQSSKRQRNPEAVGSGRWKWQC